MDKYDYLIQNYERGLTPSSEKPREPVNHKRKRISLRDTKILTAVDDKSSIVVNVGQCLQGRHQPNKSTKIKQMNIQLNDSCDNVDEIDSKEENEPEIVSYRD